VNSSNNPFGESSFPPEAAPAKRKLRSATKTFAIILLALGGLNIANAISLPFFAAIGQMFLSATAESGSDDVQLKRAVAELNQLLSPLNLSMLAISFVLGIGLVVGGIAALKHKAWGARWLRWSAGLMVILTVAQSSIQIYSQAVNRDTFLQDFEQRMGQRGGNQLPEGLENFGPVFLLLQIVFAAGIALVFAAVYGWAFLHFSKSSTLEQFEGAEQPIPPRP